MPDTPAPTPGAAARFFDHYLDCLDKASVPEKQRRWYVMRVEAFIKAQNGRRIKFLNAVDINRYFERLGREAQLAGWQFRQCVEAIRILYCDLLATPVCRTVDWDVWRDAARKLEAESSNPGAHVVQQVCAATPGRTAGGSLRQVHAVYRRLLVRVANEICRRGYSQRTRQAYEQWVCRFILFCDGRSPAQVGAAEVKTFLEYLAVERRVSASTQNQALNALVFLYDKVLDKKLGELDDFARAKRSRHVPVVLSREEVMSVLGHADVSTTMIYTHGLGRPGVEVVSPLVGLYSPEDDPD